MWGNKTIPHPNPRPTEPTPNRTADVTSHQRRVGTFRERERVLKVENGSYRDSIKPTKGFLGGSPDRQNSKLFAPGTAKPRSRPVGGRHCRPKNRRRNRPGGSTDPPRGESGAPRRSVARTRDTSLLASEIFWGWFGVSGLLVSGSAYSFGRWQQNEVWGQGVSRRGVRGEP